MTNRTPEFGIVRDRRGEKIQVRCNYGNGTHTTWTHAWAPRQLGMQCEQTHMMHDDHCDASGWQKWVGLWWQDVGTRFYLHDVWSDSWVMVQYLTIPYHLSLPSVHILRYAPDVRASGRVCDPVTTCHMLYHEKWPIHAVDLCMYLHMNSVYCVSYSIVVIKESLQK